MGCGDSCSFTGNTTSNENEIATFEHKRLNQDKENINAQAHKDAKLQNA
jgi:uncharacterized protein CbrC (UPF0167 family)